MRDCTVPSYIGKFGLDGGEPPTEVVPCVTQNFSNFPFLCSGEISFRKIKAFFWIHRKILLRQTWSEKNSGHKSYKKSQVKIFYILFLKYLKPTLHYVVVVVVVCMLCYATPAPCLPATPALDLEHKTSSRRLRVEGGVGMF